MTSCMELHIDRLIDYTALEAVGGVRHHLIQDCVGNPTIVTGNTNLDSH